MLRNPDLARSLEAVADDPATIWTGELAAAIAASSQAEGGLLDHGDLAMAPASSYEPIWTDYRGHRVYTTAPPSQGLILLEILNLLEGFDISALAPSSAELVHVVVEATRVAFADRNRWSGDPAFVRDLTTQLISKGFAEERRKLIDQNKAATVVEGGDVHGDTTSFVVIDGGATPSPSSTASPRPGAPASLPRAPGS